MRLSDHFNAFMRPANMRNYPVIAINYHKLWDNLPAVMEVATVDCGLWTVDCGRSRSRSPTHTRARTSACARSHTPCCFIFQGVGPATRVCRQVPAANRNGPKRPHRYEVGVQPAQSGLVGSALCSLLTCGCVCVRARAHARVFNKVLMLYAWLGAPLYGHVRRHRFGEWHSAREGW